MAKSTFKEGTPDREFELAVVVNDIGWRVAAVEVPGVFQGVAIRGPKDETGYLPTLNGVGISHLPQYIWHAADDMRKRVFETPTAESEEEAA